jgi:arylsulfatase A-like enzyme
MAPARPHIVVLMADTVMRQALGCYGGVARTPHIDALAARSWRFERLYQPATMCQPSRVTWMTGCLPWTTRVWANSPGCNARRERTLLRALREHGYRGGYAGLFHCWEEHDRDGLDMLDWIDWYHDWIGPQPGGPDHERLLPLFMAHLERMGVQLPDGHLLDFRDHAGHTDFPLARHPAVRLADQGVAAVDAIDPAVPHLIWLSFWMPHEPWAPPRDHLERHRLADMPLSPTWNDDLAGRPAHLARLPNRQLVSAFGHDAPERLRRIWRAYAGCMSLVDDQVGRVIAALERRGLYDDALVVFTTDHGTTHGAHGMLYKSFSGMIDEISRIPLLLKLPGQRAARTVAQVASSADLHPTLLELLGIPCGRVDGSSWAPWLAGAEPGRTRAFGVHGDGTDAEAQSVRSLRVGAWKYNRYSAPETEELYNLDEDPHETDNRARACPAETAALGAELMEASRAAGDSFVLR